MWLFATGRQSLSHSRPNAAFIYKSPWIFPLLLNLLNWGASSIHHHLVIITPPLQLTDPQIYPHFSFLHFFLLLFQQQNEEIPLIGGAPCQMFPWNLKEKLHKGQKFGNFSEESLAFRDNMGLCYSKYMHIFLFQSKAICSLLDSDK